MKRIVCRVEGARESAFRLAMLILTHVFRDQGAILRPLVVDNEPLPNGLRRQFASLGMVAESRQFRSFSQAQTAIEASVAKGTNALIMTKCFLRWDCPGDILNEPLNMLELFLHAHEVSIVLIDAYSKAVPRTRFTLIREAMTLKAWSYHARDRYSDHYCGESFVLPYGVLPTFFIELKKETTFGSHFDIRYLSQY